MTTLTLDDQLERLVARQLHSGRYGSREEVVRAGLELLEAEDDALEAWLRSEMPLRVAELEIDPASSVPAEQVLADLEARHRIRVAGAGGA